MSLQFLMQSTIILLPIAIILGCIVTAVAAWLCDDDQEDHE